MYRTGAVCLAQLAIAFRLVLSRSVRRLLRRPSSLHSHRIHRLQQHFRASNRARRASLRSRHLNTSSTSQLRPGCLGSPSRLPHLSLCLRLRALRPPALHNLVSPSSITPHSPMGHGAVAEEQHHNMRACARCDVVLRRHPRHLPPLPLLSPQAAA